MENPLVRTRKVLSGMLTEKLLEKVKSDVHCHCVAKGDTEGPGINPLVPRDCVCAFAMAKLLVELNIFDSYIAVAPEGHVYGYFFEKLENRVLSVFVDYPPKTLRTIDDLSLVTGGHVLILEDDVISGITLRFVVDELAKHTPRAMSLYLGREKDYQQVQNVPSEIERIYFAEDWLDPGLRDRFEAEFVQFFGRELE